ncbi:hypothetical protein HYH02_003645 [Chlamydomonas schloesseri]|uniref:Guanylate cyclase domain-containing protein n=1 Tax=Chlamydomonas schloesseri TaxID=2026947 RepID=A0A836BA83_9CHLO|nr:hypothetical protein HYH02_003645 [Chlamydomonas schloesseri]|eukprot:KAG2451869.1 hypothetical protein HYH02_003645 [Chlamydomonas schloesseri]
MDALQALTDSLHPDDQQQQEQQLQGDVLSAVFALEPAKRTRMFEELSRVGLWKGVVRVPPTLNAEVLEQQQQQQAAMAAFELLEEEEAMEEITAVVKQLESDEEEEGGEDGEVVPRPGDQRPSPPPPPPPPQQQQQQQPGNGALVSLRPGASGSAAQQQQQLQLQQAGSFGRSALNFAASAAVAAGRLGPGPGSQDQLASTPPLRVRSSRFAMQPPPVEPVTAPEVGDGAPGAVLLVPDGSGDPGELTPTSAAEVDLEWNNNRGNGHTPGRLSLLGSVQDTSGRLLRAQRSRPRPDSAVGPHLPGSSSLHHSGAQLATSRGPSHAGGSNHSAIGGGTSGGGAAGGGGAGAAIRSAKSFRGAHGTCGVVPGSGNHHDDARSAGSTGHGSMLGPDSAAAPHLSPQADGGMPVRATDRASLSAVRPKTATANGYVASSGVGSAASFVGLHAPGRAVSSAHISYTSFPAAPGPAVPASPGSGATTGTGTGTANSMLGRGKSSRVLMDQHGNNNCHNYLLPVPHGGGGVPSSRNNSILMADLASEHVGGNATTTTTQGSFVCDPLATSTFATLVSQAPMAGTGGLPSYGAGGLHSSAAAASASYGYGAPVVPGRGASRVGYGTGTGMLVLGTNAGGASGAQITAGEVSRKQSLDSPRCPPMRAASCALLGSARALVAPLMPSGGGVGGMAAAAYGADAAGGAGGSGRQSRVPGSQQSGAAGNGPELLGVGVMPSAGSTTQPAATSRAIAFALSLGTSPLASLGAGLPYGSNGGPTGGGGGGTLGGGVGPGGMASPRYARASALGGTGGAPFVPPQPMLGRSASRRRVSAIDVTPSGGYNAYMTAPAGGVPLLSGLHSNTGGGGDTEGEPHEVQHVRPQAASTGHRLGNRLLRDPAAATFMAATQPVPRSMSSTVGSPGGSAAAGVGGASAGSATAAGMLGSGQNGRSLAALGAQTPSGGGVGGDAGVAAFAAAVLDSGAAETHEQQQAQVAAVRYIVPAHRGRSRTAGGLTEAAGGSTAASVVAAATAYSGTASGMGSGAGGMGAMMTTAGGLAVAAHGSLNLSPLQSRVSDAVHSGLFGSPSAQAPAPLQRLSVLVPQRETGGGAGGASAAASAGRAVQLPPGTLGSEGRTGAAAADNEVALLPRGNSVAAACSGPSNIIASPFTSPYAMSGDAQHVACTQPGASAGDAARVNQLPPPVATGSNTAGTGNALAPSHAGPHQGIAVNASLGGASLHFRDTATRDVTHLQLALASNVPPPPYLMAGSTQGSAGGAGGGGAGGMLAVQQRPQYLQGGGGGGMQPGSRLVSAMMGHGGGGGGPGETWHEVWATSAVDPVTGQEVIILTQVDITAKVIAERHLALVMETEHRLVEQLFPRHILQYITEEWTSGPGGMNGGGAEAVQSPSAAQTAVAAQPSRWRPVVRDCSAMSTWHPEVTLLFADIKGFTPMCKEVEPKQVMALLNALYSRYDAMLDKYGVYKVETIGDCYFVAGGLIHEDEDGMTAVRDRSSHEDPLHAERVFMFAKAMLAAATEVRMPTTGEPVEIRIGLHTGPVVSGVVGTRMPRFCLFGDTVNTASRMESTGAPGAIHASESTFARLAMAHGDPQWESTGGIEVKGKGLMQTYVWRPSHEPHALARNAAAAGMGSATAAAAVMAASAAAAGSASGPTAAAAAAAMAVAAAAAAAASSGLSGRQRRTSAMQADEPVNTDSLQMLALVPSEQLAKVQEQDAAARLGPFVPAAAAAAVARPPRIGSEPEEPQQPVRAHPPQCRLSDEEKPTGLALAQ